MLILIGEEGWDQDISPEDMQAELQRWQDYGDALVAAGAHVASDALQESATAKTVRVGSDERLVTDGPFAESKEQVGGFYVIDVADEAEALEWAKKVPVSGGAIEVRPVMDYTQFGYQDPAEAKATA
jgi:hypothetical protein